MPILPAPSTYHCPACGWSKTVAPRSDAWMPDELFTACPVCQHQPLTCRPALSPLGALSDLLTALTRRR